MSKLIIPAVRRKAYLSTVLSWTGVLAIGSAMCLVSRPIGISIILGSLVWFIPQGYTAVKLFQHIETNPRKFVRKFYTSEMIKLLLVSIFFVFALKRHPENLAGICGGYLGTQLLFSVFYYFLF